MSQAHSLGLSSNTINEILQSNALYADDEQETICRRMIDELTVQEQELAARTSYAYWVASTSANKTDFSTDETRIRMAMREARRHLVGAAGQRVQAMNSLLYTCDFRKEWHVDDLRTCFSSADASSNTTPEEQQIWTERNSLIRQDLQTQVMVVRGHDKESRAILIRMGRTKSQTTEKAFMLAQLYMVERTIAATEVLSKGQQEKLTCVFDFGDYSSAHAPPFRILRHTVGILQNIYPERMKKLFILNPPFWMKSAYAMLHPFLAVDTRTKVNMVSGAAQRELLLGEWIDAEHATPMMLADGKLSSATDLEYFLEQVPFYQLYDKDNNA